MRYETARPRAVIRLRIAQPRTTSLPCPAGLRARRSTPRWSFHQPRLPRPGRALSARRGRSVGRPNAPEAQCPALWHGAGRPYRPSASRSATRSSWSPDCSEPPARVAGSRAPARAGQAPERLQSDAVRAVTCAPTGGCSEAPRRSRNRQIGALEPNMACLLRLAGCTPLPSFEMRPRATPSTGREPVSLGPPSAGRPRLVRSHILIEGCR